MTNSPVPFYPNTDDGLHCLQACLKSSLEALEPSRHYSFAELDEITGFEKGMLTWPMRAYTELASMGYSIVVYDSMDFRKFADSPIEYMKKEFGDELADLFSRKTNVHQAVKDTIRMLSTDNIDIRSDLPSIPELKALLDNGMMCICHVDQSFISGADEQEDHFVLVLSIKDREVIVHNPGPPAEAAQVLDSELFEKAWGAPVSYAKTILAIK